MAKLAEVLASDTCAVAHFDRYTVSVMEANYEPHFEGYDLAVSVEAMPPHSQKHFQTLEELRKELLPGGTVDNLDWEACGED